MNGKVLVLFLFVLNLYANVIAKVDKQNVIEGDSVVLSITASGNKIQFPNIKKIGSDDIEAVSSSQNISIINGNYKKTITKSYAFTPSQSLIIPSYKVIVDSKIYHTKPVKITLLKDKNEKDFKLVLLAPKETIANYPSVVTIKYYQKTNVKVGSISLNLPKGDFKFIQIGKEKNYYEGVYQVSELKYMLIAKKDVDLPIKVKLGFPTQQVDSFGFIVTGMRYKTLYKTAHIKVRKVASQIVGDFNISLNVDKKYVDSNKPINGVLKIEGYGDISNINFKLDIADVTLYDNKPTISTTLKNDKIYTTYTKKFVILADRNFTIPAFEFSFYSISQKQQKTIYTKPIHIQVVSHFAPPLENRYSYTPPATKGSNYLYLYIIFSFIIGVVVGVLFTKLKKIKIELPPNLYQKLLPYADEKKIKIILTKLYNNRSLTKDEKKYIKEFLKDKR